MEQKYGRLELRNPASALLCLKYLKSSPSSVERSLNTRHVVKRSRGRNPLGAGPFSLILDSICLFQNSELSVLRQVPLGVATPLISLEMDAKCCSLEQAQFNAHRFSNSRYSNKKSAMSWKRQNISFISQTKQLSRDNGFKIRNRIFVTAASSILKILFAQVEK